MEDWGCLCAIRFGASKEGINGTEASICFRLQRLLCDIKHSRNVAESMQ